MVMKLGILMCFVALAAASYYEDDHYGSEPAYSYEYDDYSKNSYDNAYDYNDNYDPDEPVYGAEDSNIYQPQTYNRKRYSAGYGGAVSRRRNSYSNSYYDDEYDYDNSYAPRRSSYGRRRSGRMDRYGRSGSSYGHQQSYRKPYVPVVIKKKKEKKRKIISVHTGFYVPGGTAIYGKFKDLKSCEKACELTPTCFAGDYNPWLNKCYLHNNLTACMSLRAHKQITHFKKVPCTIVETPRGLITLGAASWRGLQQKGIKSLMDCIKACATAGGGVAPMPGTAADTPQVCFGIDYDFADHTCYFHVDIAICGGTASTLATPVTPVTLYAKPSSVNILICPIAAQG